MVDRKLWVGILLPVTLEEASKISPFLTELEMLTSKLVGLEEQLCTLVRGLEASAAIGDITTEVGQLLQERTQSLDTLQQSSHWLQEELSSLAMVCVGRGTFP